MFSKYRIYRPHPCGKWIVAVGYETLPVAWADTWQQARAIVWALLPPFRPEPWVLPRRFGRAH